MAGQGISRGLGPAEPRPAFAETPPRLEPPQVRVAQALLVALALVLPFEAPLFSLGPLEMTTVEVVLYATLAAWGIVAALPLLLGKTRPAAMAASLRTEPMPRAAVLWFGALLASAAFAPTDRIATIKFTLRSLSGILLFFAARRLVRSPEVLRRVLAALLAGAMISAATALVERFVPASAPVWGLFHVGSFDVLGLRRASGVFGYPTIGAMYWEAAVPLSVVTPFLVVSPLLKEDRGTAGTRRRVCAVAAAGCLVVAAILASATRSALAGSALATLGLWVFGRRLGPGPRRGAACLLVVIAASWTLTQTMAGRSGSLLGARLRSLGDEDWFRAEWQLGEVPGVLRTDEVVFVPVVVQNAGSVPWPRDGERSVQLSYHWWRLDGGATRTDFEGIRTELPSDVAPGATSDLMARVRAPAEEGIYWLQWDLVVENVTWFSQRGQAMPEQEVIVNPSLEGGPTAALDARDVPAFAPDPPPRSALWRAAIVLWEGRPLLGIGPDNFRRRYEAVLSPSPTGQPYTDTRIHANNLYFETLADLGLAGIAALAAIGIALAKLIRAHYFANRVDGVACGLAAALFFVHGFFDYFLEFTPLFGLFWLLLGLTAAAAETPAARPSSRA